MIFVTVGTQLPFDRLVGAVDQWAASSRRDDVFAQVGPTGNPPRHIAWKPFIDADEFQRRCEQARLIVAHLGMGSIITALELGKPILVMPRRAQLNEHRNDHQAAMAQRLASSARIQVAWDQAELLEKLADESWLHRRSDQPGGSNPESLLNVIRAFVKGEAIDPAQYEVAHQNRLVLDRG